MKIYFLLFFVFFVCSCSSNTKVDELYCIDNDAFDVSIFGNDISNVSKKQIFNRIINESNIKFDETSIYLINLSINVKRTTSLVSGNNTVEIENVNFVVNYKIINKINNTLIDSGKFIIVDEVDISNNRFANYARDNYIIDNFTKNLIVKLENKVQILLNNKKCKKV